MKYIFVLIVALTLSTQIYSQEDSSIPNRKGQFAIETGASFFGGIIGGGTGASLLAGFEGDTFFNFQFDGGYFLSNRFKLKANLGVVASDNTFALIGLGGKYYLGDRIPIQILGTVIAGDGSTFSGYGSIGYAARLASNINLEPSLGVRVFGGAGILDLSAKFVMFF